MAAEVIQETTLVIQVATLVIQITKYCLTPLVVEYKGEQLL